MCVRDGRYLIVRNKSLSLNEKLLLQSGTGLVRAVQCDKKSLCAMNKCITVARVQYSFACV